MAVSLRFFRILFFVLSVFAPPTHADPLEAKTCKIWSPQDWDIFINLKVLSQMRDGSAPLIFENLQEAKDSCPKEASQPDIAKCLDRITGFYGMFVNRPEYASFSYITSDAKYYAAQPARRVELPAELKNSPNGLPKNWKELAKKNGWSWILFPSYLTGNVDLEGNRISESRLVMVIPHEEYTQMLLYYDLNRDGQTNIHPTTFDGMQMIAVEYKRDDKTLENPPVHFRSWEFNESDKMPQLKMNRSENCAACHPNGPRAIVLPPAQAFTPKFSEGTTLADINKKIVIQGKTPDYSTIYDLKHFPKHLDVGGKFECNQCHDGNNRSSLSYSIGDHAEFDREGLIEHKTAREKTMPRDPSWKPTDKEYSVMAGEIKDEYYQKLKDWLTEIKCDPSSTPAKPSSAKNSLKSAPQKPPSQKTPPKRYKHKFLQ